MPELSAEDCGLIMAALEAYAQDHPDHATAERCDALAELVATHGVTLTEHAPADDAAEVAEVAAYLEGLRRRGDAARRLPPLENGGRDPWAARAE